MATATSDITKFTNPNATFSSGNIILFMLIFFMSEAEPKIEPMACVVESLMKLKRVVASIKYSGKFSMSNLNM